MASRDALFAAADASVHPALLAAVPAIPPARGAAGPARAPLTGGPPIAGAPRRAEPAASPAVADFGCAFRDRCAYAVGICGMTVPPLEEVAAGHWVACHRSQEFMASPLAPED